MFKRKKRFKEQLICVVEYPGELSFETYYQTETGLWKRTDLVTFIPLESDEQEISNLIIKHLSWSENVKSKKHDFQKISENYSAILNNKSLKRQMKDSKMVQISKRGNEMRFVPTRNGGTSYTEISGKKVILIERQTNQNHLNACLKKALRDCE